MNCGFDFVVSVWWKEGGGWQWQMKVGWIGSGLPSGCFREYNKK
jgi:hypothetical protein